MATFKLYAFDAYGTLFDVHSAVARHKDAIGPQAGRLSELWRAKQLEYTWVRSLAGAYRDFEELTAQALDTAAASCGGLPDKLRGDLIAPIASFPPIRRCAARSRRFADAGRKPPSSPTAPRHAGGGRPLGRLADLFDAVLSVDELAIYKTAPAAYDLVRRRLGVAPAKRLSSPPTVGI